MAHPRPDAALAHRAAGAQPAGVAGAPHARRRTGHPCRTRPWQPQDGNRPSNSRALAEHVHQPASVDPPGRQPPHRSSPRTADPTPTTDPTFVAVTGPTVLLSGYVVRSRCGGRRVIAKNAKPTPALSKGQFISLLMPNHIIWGMNPPQPLD